MVDDIFDWCVLTLVEVSAIMGMTYEELNVYLFVIMFPLAIIISVLFNIFFYYKYIRRKQNKYFVKHKFKSTTEKISMVHQTKCLNDFLKSSHLCLTIM